ncbi:SID1 transmembrane family member 1-like isoform X2 [Agrilus planipennis]|uniref:SID1 transmembrane family member 1-like isoform X2 n=1 Tax=Agrilus planipennis TaxID=224129 RepID=A0A1W4WFH2_AGRPL|nr:SID1 transmembrane family member 1-like isoform X2 [Agrilus planipennis]
MFQPLIFIILFVYGSCLTPSLIKNLTYNKYYRFYIDNSLEYILQYENNSFITPLRITTKCMNSSKKFPLMAVVRQKKEILSWQLPLTVISDSGGLDFYTISRTLCPNIVENLTVSRNVFKGAKSLEFSNGVNDAPVISFSTASEEIISFSVEVTDETDFYIDLGKQYNITISPSEPRYYFYTFHQNVTVNDKYNLKTVILEVNSDDLICMTISIQNASCPIYDLNNDIKYQGLWETIDLKGGITISSRQFPAGFFIVMVAHADDSICMGSTSILSKDRTKKLTFTIKPSISFVEYAEAVTFTFLIIIAFYIVFNVSLFWYWRRIHKPRAMESIDESEPEAENGARTPSTTVADDVDNISFDETEYDTITEALNDKEVILGKPVLYLKDLARKDPRILKKKSYLYLWHVLTVALFYGLPVVQLVITYQNVLNETGNQDLCYYNFLCAHPLGILSDFNHLFSNIGYVMLGILFLIIVRRRERQHNDINFDKYYGIPQHYGLFYALGVALIAEGVLSGSYHICPNHLNFQFDSSFMYIMAVLCMVKLYQTRHPDINATAYATFGVLAVAIFLGMIGVLEANIYFWILFTILHIITCFILTAQLYYLGNWKFDKGMVRRRFQIIANDFRSGPLNILKPLHRGTS